MINLFLKAKHWQLFLFSVGIPFIIQSMLMANLFSNIESGNIPNPSIFTGYLPYFIIVMLLFVGVLFGWYWSIAIGLQSKLPEGITMKVKKFKIFFFIPMIYILFFLCFLTIGISGSGPNPSIILFILPLHLFSMFCIFYCLYFVAKTYKTVELQRETSFSDFAGEFFLIWFYFIGVWIIQPKINQMMETPNKMDN